MSEQRQILSKSIIYMYLVNNSNYFRDLVQGTAIILGLEYTYEMIGYCAGNPTVLDHFALNAGDHIDTAVLDAITDPERAEKLDNDLRYLVTEYAKTKEQ